MCPRLYMSGCWRACVWRGGGGDVMASCGGCVNLVVPTGSYVTWLRAQLP